MSKWAKLGMVSLFSPQIDPGFKGILVVPVFNAGDREVFLRHMDDLFTVEFDVSDNEQASFGWSDRMGVQERLSGDHVQMLKVRMSFYKDVVLAKGKIEVLQTSVDNAVANYSESKGKIGEFDKQMESFRKEIDARILAQGGKLDLLINVLGVFAAGLIAAIAGWVMGIIKFAPSVVS